ncbi:MAG: hypothetical protein NC311_12145 [Muribaculaceae bacterium]|nr:hypothetical protein [Muribaculaceae bacterium]
MKGLISTLVNEIQIYPEGESEIPLKSMKFNFPVYQDGKEVREIVLNKQTNVEMFEFYAKCQKQTCEENLKINLLFSLTILLSYVIFDRLSSGADDNAKKAIKSQKKLKNL